MLELNRKKVQKGRKIFFIAFLEKNFLFLKKSKFLSPKMGFCFA